jgi:geranylgeranyl diphosphate synthase, type I
MEIKDVFGRYLPDIDRELRASLREDPNLAPFYGMMRYHLGWVNERLQPASADVGKRLRPTICLLATEAAGGDYHASLPAATAIELLHNFSLVHDDIEDQSGERRHRATVWRLWGEPQAINAGDGLLMVSRLALHKLADRGVPAATVLALARDFDEACLSLCHGQFLDMSYEERTDVNVEMYLNMIGGKTAALIGYSAFAGAVIGGEGGRAAEGYRRFGRDLGLAFQIVDDVLGIWGDPKVTGKPAAEDILSKKKSLPVVYAFEKARGARRQALDETYAKPMIEPEDVARVLELLAEVGARAYTQRMAEVYRDHALAELPPAEMSNPAQDGLRLLASYLVDRVY